MINFLKRLFGSKEVVESTVALEFSITEDQAGNAATVLLKIPNAFRLSKYVRNSDLGIDVTSLSDDEIAFMLMHKYSLEWLTENFKRPLYVETHSFSEDTTIKYERAWNKTFIQRVAGLNLGPLPESEDELAEMYMNYIYASRLMEEEEIRANTDPISVAHPSLANPNNQIRN